MTEKASPKIKSDIFFVRYLLNSFYHLTASITISVTRWSNLCNTIVAVAMSPEGASGKRKGTDNQKTRRPVKKQKGSATDTKDSPSSEGTREQNLSDSQDSVDDEDDVGIAGPSSRPQVAQESWKNNLHKLGVRQALEQAQRQVGVNQQVEGTPYRYTDDSDPTIGVHPDPTVRKRRNARWGKTLAAFISSDSCLNEKGWRGVRPIGSGGYGMVGLWSRTIKEGNGDEEEEEEEEDDNDKENDEEDDEEEEEDDDDNDEERTGTGKKGKNKGKGKSDGSQTSESKPTKKGKGKERERKPKEVSKSDRVFKCVCMM